MNNFIDYIYISEYIAPAFSALSCAILLLLSYRDIHSGQEHKIKKIVFLYMCCSFVAWTTTFLYIFFPELFVYIQALTLLSLLCVQVLFYHLFKILTRQEVNERFSKWHYLIPAILTSILLVWSFFVPYEVQLEIVLGKGKVIPMGYEPYTYLFISKLPLRLLYCVLYMTLVLIRLFKYYKAINHSSSLVRKPAQWVSLIVILTIASVVISVVASSMRAGGLYLSTFALIATIMMISQHIILTYHIIRRHYLLYVTLPHQADKKMEDCSDIMSRKGENEIVDQSEIITDSIPSKLRKPYTRSERPLSRRNFEAYMKKHKPYLDPDFKITDLADSMNINRTYISGFVNKTYAVNFNRYINQLRIKELNRLLTFASNEKKNVRDLVQKAGFSDYKHYLRALKAEQEGQTNRLI